MGFSFGGSVAKKQALLPEIDLLDLRCMIPVIFSRIYIMSKFKGLGRRLINVNLSECHQITDTAKQAFKGI